MQSNIAPAVAVGGAALAVGSAGLGYTIGSDLADNGY